MSIDEDTMSNASTVADNESDDPFESESADSVSSEEPPPKKSSKIRS